MGRAYWCVLALGVVACGETVGAGGVDWNELMNVPPGFADGTDDGTTYTAGSGLTIADNAFAVAFGGNGTATTASRSDHTHAWDDIQNKPDGWVKLESVARIDSTTFSFTGLDGNAYRRFRIEVEGIASVAGADRVITIRPNGTTAGYGPTSMHWGGHTPGITYDHAVSNVGNPVNSLPICATHYNQDGHVLCTAEMNTKTGRFRFASSHSVFATALTTCGSSGTGCVIEDSIVSVWRDPATNITSLEVGFPGITVFTGDITLWALK